MRHGYCSTSPDSEPSSSAATSAAPAQRASCPFAGYTSLFGASAAPGAITTASDQFKKMIEEIALARSSGVDDLPKDASDPKQSHGSIPAGYTYFAQLVIHDLTHSVAIAGRNGASPTLRNLNTPNLDLDTIYGGDPARCPHLYQPPRTTPSQGADDDGRHLFYLGRTAKPAFPQNWREGYGLPFDLPRVDTGSPGITETAYRSAVTPLVHDDRNDDNLILAQLTAQFLLAHNTVASCLRRNGDPSDGGRKLSNQESFALARHFMLKAYRRIVVHDLLKQLLLPRVYEDLMHNRIKGHDHLPVEFLFGVARVGHAMVRAAYTINPHIGLEAGNLGRLMSFSGHAPYANLPLPADWVVDWRNLLEIESSGIKPQNARRISPFLAPAFVHGELKSRSTGLEGSLSFHDLWRCYQFGVPTGQECARQSARPGSPAILSGDSMLPTAAFTDLHLAGNLITALTKYPEFLKKTPLSYYLLQESAVYGLNGRYLGPLGSEIFAKTILYALMTPPDSPTGHGGLAFDELHGPSGISKLPQLLEVPNMTDVELATTIADTLR